MLDAINEDVNNIINEEYRINSVMELNKLRNNEEINEKYNKQITFYCKKAFSIVIYSNLITYILIRFSAIPIVNRIIDLFKEKVYCNIKMKDGSFYREVEFINRNERFFIIKENEQYKSIFLNIDEIVEIKFSYYNSIFIR